MLELGCGTGEDARFLAERGVRVTATDASRPMLDITAAKTAHTGRVTTLPLDLTALPDLPTAFDGALSNFGAINCLSDWKGLALWLADRVKAGGWVALGVMSPLCLWEIGWHSLHGNFRTAFRRQHRGGATFQPDGAAAPLRVHYPSVRRLESDFAPQFRRVHVEPLGVFLPPSDVYGVVERRPRLLRALMALDGRVGRVPALANIADHYWIEFVRQ